MEMCAYVDADFASCESTSRSTTGYAILMSGSAIAWRSIRQSLVTLSTTESEIVAASEATRQVKWYRNILKECGLLNEHPTVMYEDNNGCIGIVKKPENRPRTRHIASKHRYVIEIYEQ
jgi:hypothetical protein